MTVTATQLGDPSNSIVSTFDILEVNCGVRFQDITTDPVHTVLMNSYVGTSKVINFPISAANNTPDECFSSPSLIWDGWRFNGAWLSSTAWVSRGDYSQVAGANLSLDFAGMTFSDIAGTYACL